MTRVKICGITQLDDGRCATEAGADYLGFIFYPKSARYIAPAHAGAIVQALRAEFGPRTPTMVGVFVNEPMAGVAAIVNEANLDLVQLHGDESPATVAQLRPHAFKALRPRTLDEAKRALEAYASGGPVGNKRPDLLVDAYHPTERGGTGHRADLEIATWLASRCRLLLAGGLRPENVRDAIVSIRPWGVDVSSGVEKAKGVKDHQRVRAFVRAVQLADKALDGERSSHI
ncbi:MAG: phosphoribosylanthranilate isomerase [Anaerolineae bacterium]